MIRHATMDDWSEVDRMAQAFHEQAPWASYRAGHFIKTFATLAQDANGLALILDLSGPKGVLLAGALPSPFSGEQVAQEILWWVDPGARSPRHAAAMLDAFEKWIREVGASAGGLACLDDRTAKLFQRRGYIQTEHVYRVT